MGKVRDAEDAVASTRDACATQSSETIIMAIARMNTRGLTSLELIERKVQLQNIDSEIAENAEVPALSVLANQLAHLFFT